jgi:hypothetical protein
MKIIGRFIGEIVHHPDPKLKLRRIAYGNIIHDLNGQERIIPTRGAKVKRFGPEQDFKRYVKVRKGQRDKQDQIIGMID